MKQSTTSSLSNLLEGVNWPDNASESFLVDRYLHINSLITASQARAIELQAEQLSRRLVSVPGCPHKQWRSVDIAPSSSIFKFVAESNLGPYVAGVIGKAWDPSSKILMWIHEYYLSEFIPKHKDAFGTIQLMIALRSSISDNGGEFIIELNDKETAFKLDSGDAVLFNATEYSHWSNPIKSSNACSNKTVRAVLIVRFFFN
jgi:hypothetical protein